MASKSNKLLNFHSNTINTENKAKTWKHREKLKHYENLSYQRIEPNLETSGKKLKHFGQDRSDRPHSRHTPDAALGPYKKKLRSSEKMTT